MTRKLKARLAIGTLAALAFTVILVQLVAQAPEKIDLDALQKIRAAETSGSQVMTIESWLSDVYGPRPTNSPYMREAAKWAEAEMTKWGIANVKEEPWTFGRGWSNDYMMAQEVSPRVYPLIAYAPAWNPGTKGDIKAAAVIVDAASAEDLAKYKGTLRGKFVLDQAPVVVNGIAASEVERYSPDQLNALGLIPDPTAARGGRGGAAAARGGRGAAAAAAPGTPVPPSAGELLQFYLDEGVACVVHHGSGNSNDGTVFVSQTALPAAARGAAPAPAAGAAPGAPAAAGRGAGGGRGPTYYSADAPATPCQVTLANESYGRIYRTLELKVPVTLEMNIKNTFHSESGLDSFNITGEIPGTDLADQIVMLGGHFDSWQSGTGATDNAAGSAVMMEALRLLKTTPGIKLRRTVRIALWTGEEEGLLGSRAYALQHFRDAGGNLLPEQAKISGYFNVDNGSGTLRGIYLQGNYLTGPLFEQWMKPYADLGMTQIAPGNTGGTDHLSFVADGIPGFQFIQDPLDYETRTHHSSADVYEHVVPWDMERISMIVAGFVYMTANRDQMLPRMPLAAAAAGRGAGGRGAAAPPATPATAGARGGGGNR